MTISDLLTWAMVGLFVAGVIMYKRRHVGRGLVSQLAAALGVVSLAKITSDWPLAFFGAAMLIAVVVKSTDRPHMASTRQI